MCFNFNDETEGNQSVNTPYNKGKRHKSRKDLGKFIFRTITV